MTKVLISTKCVGITGQDESFDSPIFITLMMFMSMSLALFVHFILEFTLFPFPGYAKESNASKFKPAQLALGDDEDAHMPQQLKLQPQPQSFRSKCISVLLPTLFDLVATVFYMCGLLFVDASILQLLKGSPYPAHYHRVFG
jgi:hypothetical protein